MRTSRLFVAVAAAAAIMFTTVSPAAGYAGFGDVERDGFYTEGVQWMVDNDITEGTTPECFAPYQPIDRGQAAVFMWRMEGRQTPSAPHPFTDVPAWMSDAVAWMVEQEVTLGTTDTTYSPGQILTRAELVTFLWRLAGSPAPTSTVHPFNDITPGAFYYTAVLWAVEQEITLGTTDTTFSPNDTVTRGQVATFFYRYKGEPAVTVDPASPICGVDPSERDELNGGFGLTGWTWYRDARDSHTFTEVPGSLSFAHGFDEQRVVRPSVASEISVETTVDFVPVANFQRAGIVARFDDTNEVRIVRSFCSGCGGDGIYFVSVENGVIGDSEQLLPGGLPSTVHLRLTHEDGRFRGSYSLDGTTWTEVGSRVRSLAGAEVGLYTGGKQGSTPAPTAHFDSFEQTALCDPDVC